LKESFETSQPTISPWDKMRKAALPIFSSGAKNSSIPAFTEPSKPASTAQDAALGRSKSVKSSKNQFLSVVLCAAERVKAAALATLKSKPKGQSTVFFEPKSRGTLPIHTPRCYHFPPLRPYSPYTEHNPVAQNITEPAAHNTTPSSPLAHGEDEHKNTLASLLNYTYVLCSPQRTMDGLIFIAWSTRLCSA
jgi:hypothetical protein